MTEREDQPRRLWLPLKIIGSEPSFIGKTKLQKMVFIIQEKTGWRQYDFSKYKYGPYSQQLDIELFNSSHLVRIDTILTFKVQDRVYYRFQLTDEGRQFVEYVEKKKLIQEQLVKNVEKLIHDLSKLPLEKLLDMAYSEFKILTPTKLISIMERLSILKKDVEDVFNRYGNRQALFVLMVLDYVVEVLERIKEESSIDDVYRATVMKLSEEVIDKCEYVRSKISPPVESETLRPFFIEIADVWSSLMEYCIVRKITDNPLDRKLEDILSEEEAIRLQQALAEIDLHQ